MEQLGPIEPCQIIDFPLAIDLREADRIRVGRPAVAADLPFQGGRVCFRSIVGDDQTIPERRRIVLEPGPGVCILKREIDLVIQSGSGFHQLLVDRIGDLPVIAIRIDGVALSWGILGL